MSLNGTDKRNLIGLEDGLLDSRVSTKHHKCIYIMLGSEEELEKM